MKMAPLAALIAAIGPEIGAASVAVGETGLAFGIPTAAGFGTLAGYAGLGLMAGGLYQGGQAAAAEAKSQEAVATYNAKVQEQEARAIEQQTRFRQIRQAEEASRYGKGLLASMGTAGVQTTAGAPLMIQAEQASQAELDNLMIGYEGMIGAGRAGSQGTLDTLQGAIYKTRARSAGTAGTIGAGTTLLQGFSRNF